MIPTSRNLTRVISFRTTPERAVELGLFRDTFDPPHWADAFRWLLEHPDVHAIITDRIRENDHHA